MSRPSHPDRYPIMWLNMLRKMYKMSLREDVRFPVDSSKEAKALILEFNCFRAAAIKHGWAENIRHGIEKGVGYPFLLTLAAEQIDGTVRIYNRNEGNLNARIAKYEKVIDELVIDAQELIESPLKPLKSSSALTNVSLNAKDSHFGDYEETDYDSDPDS